MNHNPIRVIAAVLACVVLLAAWSGQGRAQGTAVDAARDMVDRVLRDAGKTRGGDLDAWSRSVIERALEGAGRKASGASVPLPAEEHAGRVAGGLSARPHGPEVMVFMSLSAPAGELASMEPRGGADRGAAGAARARSGRVAGHGEAHRAVFGPRIRSGDRSAPVPALRHHGGPGRGGGSGRGSGL